MTNKQDKIYIKYANDVLSNKIPACEAIILACKRFISWFERNDIYFDYKDVDRKIGFIYKLRHSTGQHNGKHFELLPWQQFCIANILPFFNIIALIKYIFEQYVCSLEKSKKQNIK